MADLRQPPKTAEDLRANLRGRVESNLRVYQRRVDAGTATEFDQGKRAAFRAVLSMLEARPITPTFSCGRADIAAVDPTGGHLGDLDG